MEELICNVSIKQEQEKREKNGVLIGLWCWEKDTEACKKKLTIDFVI